MRMPAGPKSGTTCSSEPTPCSRRPRGIAALDLSREPAATREAYGHTSFGQSCLLGRRLVEAGVPYVQVNWSQYVEVFYPFSDYGWDTHADNFGLLADWHGPLLDRVFSTLLDDLGRRGLLETTLVVCMGEFGRTPRINEIGSRDHWHSVLLLDLGRRRRAARPDHRRERRPGRTSRHRPDHAGHGRHDDPGTGRHQFGRPRRAARAAGRTGHP